MKRLENQPVATAVLCAILVGAIVVTVLRIKGPAATAAGGPVAASDARTSARSAVQADSAYEQSGRQRDPFLHDLLFSGADATDAANTEAGPAGGLPGLRDSSASPVMFPGLQGLKLDTIPTAFGQARPPDAQPASGVAVGPDLHLQAIVWGTEPLVVIKDGRDKSYFVRVGDRFAESCEVTLIEAGRARVRRGEAILTLRLGGGSKTDEDVNS